MDKKDKSALAALFTEADKYREYFAEDETALQGVVERLTTLQTISDKQIETISQMLAASPVSGRGTQHYLVEHIEQAIAIQSQMQSALKEKRAIKEKAVESALKTMKGEDLGDVNEVLASLQKMIQDERKKADELQEQMPTETSMSEDEVDNEIAKKLGKN